MTNTSSNSHSGNPYIAVFEGITSRSVKEVKERIIKDAEILGLKDGFILGEITQDPNLTLEEMIDILALESDDNAALKQLIIAVRVNLQRVKLSKYKPEPKGFADSMAALSDGDEDDDEEAEEKAMIRSSDEDSESDSDAEDLEQ